MPPSRPTTPASNTHVFSGVTPQAITSLRDQAGKQSQPGMSYALELDPDGVGGLLTMHTPMGDVVVHFSYNNGLSELTLTIVKKPMLVPARMIVEGTSQVLRQAAAQAGPPAANTADGD